MTADSEDSNGVSESLEEILSEVHGVGPKIIDNFAEADLESIEDVAGLTPIQIEDRVDGVGLDKAQRIFDELDSEDETDYSSVKTDISFTAVDEDFPKYVSPLLNQASNTAGSTEPEKVGKMSEIFERNKFDSIEEWGDWYLDASHTEGLDECLRGKTGEELIENAIDNTWEMVQNYKHALEKIERDTVKRWIEDLILVKTAEGMAQEQKVFEYLSEEYGLELTDSSPEEESRGIDGYLGDIPVSVKSTEYTSDGRREAIEDIDHLLVFYFIGDADDDEEDGERPLYLYYDESKLESAAAGVEEDA